MVPGTGLEPASREAADFRHTASFDADDARIVVRALDYAFAIAFEHEQARAPRIRRPPSSLYTFRETAWWTAIFSGLARRCLGAIGSLAIVIASAGAPGGSPNLKGSAPTVSGRALNRLSPLCLPISSPGQGGRDSTTGRGARSDESPARRTRRTHRVGSYAAVLA